MSSPPDPVYQPAFYTSVPTKRLLAWGFDTVIILVICLFIGIFTLTLAFWFFPVLVATVSFAYRVITLSTWSATLGMRMMSIEFRRDDGQKFDFATALLHTLGYMVSFGFLLLQIVSVVLMATSARGQGLTDMVLGTTALNQRA